MNRVLTGSLLAAALGVTFSACDSGLGGYVYSTADCSAFSSCDTCTPVLGCGWCTVPGGAGVCVSDPDYCPTQQFTWTWNISGCRVGADASVGPTVDAGSTDAAVGDDSAPEASVQDSPIAPGDAFPDVPLATLDASGG